MNPRSEPLGVLACFKDLFVRFDTVRSCKCVSTTMSSGLVFSEAPSRRACVYNAAIIYSSVVGIWPLYHMGGISCLSSSIRGEYAQSVFSIDYDKLYELGYRRPYFLTR